MDWTKVYWNLASLLTPSQKLSESLVEICSQKELKQRRSFFGTVLPQGNWPHKQPQTWVEYVETADLKSAGKRMKRNKNGHKLTKNIIKSFKFWLTCRGSQVRVLYRPPDNLLEPQGFGRFFAACLTFLPYFLPYFNYPAETLLMTCSIRSALSLRIWAVTCP